MSASAAPSEETVSSRSLIARFSAAVERETEVDTASSLATSLRSPGESTVGIHA